jgi:DNA replication protein DnaC
MDTTTKTTQVVECATHGAYESTIRCTRDNSDPDALTETLYSNCPKCADESVEQYDCHKHGAYESRILMRQQIGDGEPWEMRTECPGCKADEDRMWVAKREEAFAKRVERSGLPPRFLECSFENYQATTDAQRNLLAKLKDYISVIAGGKHRGRSCVLIGHTGTGKTHLMAATATELMRQGREVRYTTVQRMFRSIKDTFVKGSKLTESQVISDFARADLLILDEVGVQYGTTFESNYMFDILNERYEFMRPTLFVSNAGREDVCKFLGDRVVDRLRQDGGDFWVSAWGSYRRQKS